MNTLMNHKNNNVVACSRNTITRLRKTKKTNIRKFKILVVEDHPLNQYVARACLEKMGYLVDIAGTAKEALALHKATTYAAILMDIDLPDMLGTEITREIRQTEARLGTRTPIIALTANGYEVKAKCLASGMDDFSQKPFILAELDSTIKKWVK